MYEEQNFLESRNRKLIVTVGAPGGLEAYTLYVVAAKFGHMFEEDKSVRAYTFKSH